MSEKYQLVTQVLGYRNKEDETNTSPGLLVEGSQNVLTNDGERIAVREGYTLDGQANAALTPIKSSYDWLRHAGDFRHVRSYEGELEYRYVDSAGTVTWRRLANGFGSAVNFNYAEFWDSIELIDRLCLVNGSSNIYDWTGGITTFASATASTITQQGAVTWGEQGFYSTGTMTVVMNGTTYTYTSLSGDTIYGVTPDPLSSTFDQSQTTQNALTPFGETNLTTKANSVAQSFIAGAAPLVGVQLYKSADTGTFTGTVTVDIYADFAGVPTGASLGTATITNAAWLLKPVGLFGVTFASPATLTVGLTYWIKVSASTASDANHPNIGTNSAGGYASGEVKRNNTVDGWVAVATIDFFFKTVTATTTPTTGEIIHQGLRTTANSAITDLPDDFENDLISVLYNQIYIGSFVSRQVYVSKQNSITDFSFSSPRTPGQGALITLDATPIGFIPQEEAMYISAGQSLWYQITFTLAADLQNESLNIQRLKTGEQQGAQSQALITKNKNDVVFVSNEPTVVSLGRLELVEKPQVKNISDPIKNDMDVYDFTGGSTMYFQDNQYIAIPVEGVVRIFNIAKSWWEAPQVLPIARFSIIDGELYGHSSVVPETYKLFDGANDNGAPINAKANFSYQQFGDRANYKNFTEFYSEGYISSNTELTLRILYEYKGSESIREFTISGTDEDILFFPTSDGSLGKQSLGKMSLAGRGETISETLPPKYRVIKDMVAQDFYEIQVQYESDGEDQRWELLAWGPNVAMSTAQNVKISQ